MKRILLTTITAVGLFLGIAGSASAQTTLVAGSVWQINSEGVYIQNSNGVTYVRANEANFYVNGTPVDFRYLGVGQPINAYANRVIYQGQVSGYPAYQPPYQSPSQAHPYRHDNRKSNRYNNSKYSYPYGYRR